MAGLVRDTDLGRFDHDVLESKTPTVVDVWAPWCMPCRRLAPIVEELAGELQGRVSFFKVNADDNGDLAVRYGVRGIPVLLLFKDGRVIDRKTGLDTKDNVKAFIERHLG